MQWFPPTNAFLTSLVLNAYYIKKITYCTAPDNNEIGSASRSFKKRDTSALKNTTETKYKRNKEWIRRSKGLTDNAFLHLQQNNKFWQTTSSCTKCRHSLHKKEIPVNHTYFIIPAVKVIRGFTMSVPVLILDGFFHKTEKFRVNQRKQR